MEFKSCKSVRRHELRCTNSIKVNFKSIYWLSVITLQLLLLITQMQFTNAADEIRVGGLFELHDTNEEIIFRQAVDAINKDENLLPQTRLSAQIESVPNDDSLGVARKACSVIKSGIGAIFGPQSANTSAHVESICDALTIPHIVNKRDFTGNDYSINLYPHMSTLAKAHTEVLKSLGWKRFCIIYENNNGLIRVQELIKDEYFHVSLRQLPSTGDYRAMLEEAKDDGVTNIVLDVEKANIFTVLKQAQQVGMMTVYYNYFITSLDLHTVDVEDFRYGDTRISALQLVDPQNPMVQRIIQDLQKINKNHNNNMQTEMALMYDAVHMFAKALDDLQRSKHITITSLDCDGAATWPDGVELLNYIRAVQINGLTGLIRFDSEGFRKDVTLDVVKLTNGGLKKIGSWNQSSGVNYLGANKDVQVDSEETLKDKTLIVTAILNEPYVMLTDPSEEASGNDRYEGFCIDLLIQISYYLGFNFTVVLSPDNAYGALDSETNKWKGMIGELINHRADLAIADLTITADREQVVDFTYPWMNTGISILYKKPIYTDPSWYRFLVPLGIEVWIYVALASLGVSLLLFALARLSPYERVENPSIQEISGPKKENQFTLDNSLWFIMGSFLQQKTEQHPRAASTRIVALMWWFFVLIMVCSYIANLTVFFIESEDRYDMPIENIEDLASQSKIKYGTFNGGSTQNFFKTSNIETYQKIYRSMESQRPSTYTVSAREGVDRVSKAYGSYAFLMESATIEYIVERRCDLIQIGGLLDSKAYGFALPPGSPYSKRINGAILRLQQDGILHKLKKKWWKEERGGGRCKTWSIELDPDASKNRPFFELRVDYAGGVFVVLLFGMGLATLVAIGEFAYKHFKSRRS